MYVHICGTRGGQERALDPPRGGVTGGHLCGYLESNFSTLKDQEVS